MGHPVELLADRAIDGRVPVPVHVAPQRGDAVEIRAPAVVEEVPPFRALDRQRLLLLPALLLGEGVPKEGVVFGGDARRELHGHEGDGN